LSKELEEGEDIIWNGKPEGAPFVPRWLPAFLLGLVLLVAPLLETMIAPLVRVLAGLNPLLLLGFSFIGSVWLSVSIHTALFTRYTITNPRVIVRGGAIGSSSIGFDDNDVVGVYVEIGYIDRIFGVGTVVVKMRTHGQVLNEPYNIPKNYYRKLYALRNPHDICQLLEEAIKKYNASFGEK